MAVPLRLGMRGYDYARMRGWSEGHGRDGFAGTKVRFFELWNYSVIELWRIRLCGDWRLRPPCR